MLKPALTAHGSLYSIIAAFCSLCSQIYKSVNPPPSHDFKRHNNLHNSIPSGLHGGQVHLEDDEGLLMTIKRQA